MPYIINKIIHILVTRESMHADGNRDPYQKPERPGTTWKKIKGGKRDEKTKQGIDDKRADRNQERASEIIGSGMNDITRRITETEITDLINRHIHLIGKKFMPQFMNNYAWKGQKRDKRSRNQKHKLSLSQKIKNSLSGAYWIGPNRIRTGAFYLDGVIC